MFVITVIPISRGISKETLTYLSTSILKEGSLIDVPLRKKVVKAIIVKVEDAKTKKLSLKSSSFVLKKVDSLKERDFLPKWIMRVIEKMSDHYATTQGAVLYAVLGKNIFDNEINSFGVRKNKSRKIESIEGSFEYRIKKYEEIIKNNTIENCQTIILFPTLDSLNQTNEKLENKYKSQIIIFNSKINKKKFLTNLEKMQTQKSNIVLTTGSYLFLTPPNTQTLIVEEENSRWYKTRNRPYVDFIRIAEEIANNLSINTVYGDVLLRNETYFSNPKIKKENTSKIPVKLIYSKEKNEDKLIDQKKTNYSPLDEEIKNEIKKTISSKGNVFIWVPRKGYSPIVLCQHCGATVKCHKCDSPVVLHVNDKEIPPSPRYGEARYFLCHHCGDKRSALEKCAVCQSWKLESFGIGIERIEEEVKKEWKDKIIQIEIGTEKTIYDLKSMYDLVIIPSIDSLLSLPDFNIDERLYRTILLLKEKTRKKMIIKTKYKDLPLIPYIENENSTDFHEDRLQKREKFGYPPFKTLIKITLKGKKSVVADQVLKIKKDLENWNPSVFPAFIKTINNLFIMHILFKIETKKWPDRELLEYLRTLPPSIEINVDPESLL